MGGGFWSQFISGTIINRFPTKTGAYPLRHIAVVFALQAVLVLAGFGLLLQPAKAIETDI